MSQWSESEGSSPTADSSDYDEIGHYLLPEGIRTAYIEEGIFGYLPGGFQPVHLGDRYDRGRYEIRHELGFGDNSTVWLARDLFLEDWVALKMVSADQTETVCQKILLSSSLLKTQPCGPLSTITSHHHCTFRI